METKRCSKCGEVKAIKKFSLNSTLKIILVNPAKKYYRNICTACRSKKNYQLSGKKWSKEHPDRRNEWKKRNPEYYKEYYKLHRRNRTSPQYFEEFLKRREEIKESRRKYYLINKERQGECRRKYYKQHPNEMRAKNQRYRRRHLLDIKQHKRIAVSKLMDWYVRGTLASRFKISASAVTDEIVELQHERILLSRNLKQLKEVYYEPNDSNSQRIESKDAASY